jgi:hypothetical protein
MATLFVPRIPNLVKAHGARPLAALRTRLCRVQRHLADSPLDNPVLHVRPRLNAAARPRAHWHTVRTSDGAMRLEAVWRPEP